MEAEPIIQAQQDIISYELPSNPQDLQKFIAIIKSNPWDNDIRIWERIVSVSLSWIQQLDDLLTPQ